VRDPGPEGHMSTTALPSNMISLGAPAADKRLTVFNTGHVTPPAQATKEILDWLDKYMGPPLLKKN